MSSRDGRLILAYLLVAMFAPILLVAGLIDGLLGVVRSIVASFFAGPREVRRVWSDVSSWNMGGPIHPFRYWSAIAGFLIAYAAIGYGVWRLL